MVDIQSATIALQASAQSSSAALTPVQASVTNASQALSNLDRSIQINATPVALSTANELTLISALGSVTVTLASHIDATETQNLLQQLLNAVQAQKPITVSLQPGSPPAQAVLLLPTTASATTNAAQNAPALTSLSPSPAPVLAQGEVLSAIILPSSATQSVISSVAPPNFNVVPVSAVNTAPVPISPNAQLTQGNSPPIAAPNFPAAPLSQAVETVSPSVAVPQASNIAAQAQSANVAYEAQPNTSAPLQNSAPMQTTAVQSPVTTTVQQNYGYSSAQPAPPLTTLLQPGNAVTLRVDAVALPATQNAAVPVLQTVSILPAPNASQITATVVGTGTNGQLLLKAGDVTFFVKTPVTAPVGAEILLTVEEPKTETPFILPQNSAMNFQLLPQAIAALAQIDPQALAHMLTTRMPQPTDYMPGSLLFLLNAFKQGNAGDWLGENITETLIRAGRADIVNSLSQELGNAGQAAQDAIVGEWRTYPIPLYSGQQFQALTLYVHSDRDARKDHSGMTASGTGKIRFLIDMRLSKLGAMQLDGFVQQKKLDMILRSEAILPEGLHNELRSAYIKALGAVGYAGALNFQAGRQHWVKMQTPALDGITT